MDPVPGSPKPDHLIGQTIGNYLVTQKLGEGGMGSVYLAEHPGIGKKVALKILHPEHSSNTEVADRFFREARAINAIGHPNIVDVVDYGVIPFGQVGRDQLVYFIMEYLDGITLSRVIKTEAPIPVERAFAIAMQVADALSASHVRGIIHRDLKPDNIILQQRATHRDYVKLLDFGIAKVADEAGHRTKVGLVIGTPAYMAPEQCEGRSNVDGRTDVYALGVVLYEMLTGRPPFVGEGYRDVLMQHLTQHPIPPSRYGVLLPHVEAVVLKALEKRPELRYPSMDEMMRAMADPVAYVEARGGVSSFLTRPLSESRTPLPGRLLTPSASWSGSGAHALHGTPSPGRLSAAELPTTIDLAAVQPEPPRSRVGFVIATLLIVAAAGAGLAIVLSGRDDGAAESEEAPPETANDPPPRPVSEPIAPPEVTTGSARPAPPPATQPPAVADPVMSTITLTTKPAGAAIFVDGKPTGRKTPQPILIDRARTKVTVTLKLDRHEELVLKNFSVVDDVTDFYALKRKPGTSRRTGSGSAAAPPVEPGAGSGSDDNDALERP